MAIQRFPGVRTGPLGERMAKFLEAYPRADEIRITSGLRDVAGQIGSQHRLRIAKTS